MAYSELVKNFSRIREYMREFYVYGFKSREEYTNKSARSYDDERRRLESWLKDYMGFRQTPEGKNVFLSVDSRSSAHNPLYKAWKTKSFTDGDITLHFLLFDILYDTTVSFTIGQIMEKLDDCLLQFENPRVFDESTVRKKLKEYASQGLIVMEKKGKAMYYRRAEDGILPDEDILHFFSEVLPCGVIGSFLLDKTENQPGYFMFKHHYITQTMDSEILYALFTAIRQKRSVTMETMNRYKDKITEHHVVPLKIMISTQSGRQYVMAYNPQYGRISSFRIDNIASVKTEEISDRYEELQKTLEGMLPHIWGVSTQGWSKSRMEHVEFTVRYSDEEQYIKGRLEREKRCGIVEHLDNNTSRFSADVYDASEMIPWIRTFICRITDIHFSDSEMEERFRNDIRQMYELYGLGGDR
ncbi:MAG: WYL domain-containing protein [Erysipelotrichaceae bacterium]|nr:WYL domain-containing protein [Erysipelotrichaceae bacterium]